MTTAFTAVDVPVRGGALRVGVSEADAGAPTVLLVHGVTASHLAWTAVTDALHESMPGVRLLAPDLRGRGLSRDLSGPAGMAAHADDLRDVLDHFAVDRTLVVGHSMGAFVSVVLAHRHPERVSRLLLIDGGLPLAVPDGLDPQEVVAHVLGPTAARLSMRFGSVGEYLDFWRAHPAFADDWSPQLEEYLAYDLAPDGAGSFRPATAYETVVDDSTDMNLTSAVPDALAALRHPARLLTVPRGLQNEEPGLYAAERLPALLAEYPGLVHERIDGFNHYTIVMSAEGGRVIADRIRHEITGS